jgi:hypothetical protein
MYDIPDKKFLFCLSISETEMTSVVDGKVKKQKAAINYDLFELKLDFSSELKSFEKDVSKFGVVSVTRNYQSQFF